MPASRREFLAGGIGAASALAANRSPLTARHLDGFEIAARHTIVRDGPTPDFFEGMLLGNGDIGVCITVRPDALGLHIGKSDSWDIRVSEEHAPEILPFRDVLALWNRASEEAKRQGHPDMLYLEEKIPFFREYAERMASSYRQTWPRPWPCGIVWVHWDATRVHIEQQSLNPANGHYQLKLRVDDVPVNVHAFVNTASGHLCLWSDRAARFSSIAYLPHLDAAAKLPNPQIDGFISEKTPEFSAYQRFPAIAPTANNPHPPPLEQDRNFSLYAVIQGEWQFSGLEEAKQMLAGDLTDIDPGKWRAAYPSVTLKSEKAQPLRIDLALFTPRDHKETAAFSKAEAKRLAGLAPESIEQASEGYWRKYWSCSAVELKDKELERWWYHNQYWLGCCLREGKIAPGLFGNWTSGKIGTAWHGDYHMNYNTQQVFWGVFSSNHADQHEPYIELVEKLMPMSEKYAKEKFALPGAYFPHSAYPVPSRVVPYPAPPWGYEICETPWTVQSLWWHYKYTRDEAVLRRVYPILKSAAQFVAAYVKLGQDGKYHVDPTVSPENWGCTVDFRLNRDCIMDLALIDFLLQAVAEASEILQRDAEDRKTWLQIREKLASYPRANGDGGEVWLDVPNAPAGWIYNVPVTLAPVFPGERIGLYSSPADLKIARRTAATIRLEGGNDIVYQPLIRARLGMLDLDWFKREVRYCLMPNGIVQDRVRQVGGRYRDTTDFDFMLRMGVWTENLSLPAVLNECMLQSYSGTLHVFPNTMGLGPARFRNLRAAGAFLVSAAWDGNTISEIEILSEKGIPVRMVDPWGHGEAKAESGGERITTHRDGTMIEFATEAGQVYSVKRL